MPELGGRLGMSTPHSEVNGCSVLGRVAIAPETATNLRVDFETSGTCHVTRKSKEKQRRRHRGTIPPRAQGSTDTGCVSGCAERGT